MTTLYQNKLVMEIYEAHKGYIFARLYVRAIN